MLRLTIAIFLIAQSLPALTAETGFSRAVPEVMAGGAGLLLGAGLWTPIVGGLVALIELGLATAHTADPWRSVLTAAIAVGLALLGPGAWSVDARIYGRRRIAVRDR
jgi:putative oxidoreductase